MKSTLPEPTASAQRVWSAVRQLRRFSLSDLVAVTECDKRYVRGQLDRWRRFEIVRNDNDGFRLALDLGPKPPHVRKDRSKPAVDRNKGGEIAPVQVERAPSPLKGKPGMHRGRPKPPGSGRKKSAVQPTEEERRARNRDYMRASRARRAGGAA